jgi:hypothetical protein
MLSQNIIHVGPKVKVDISPLPVVLVSKEAVGDTK